MKPDAYARRERDKLVGIANKLELDGYRVIIEPGREALPEALKGLRPDLVAFGPNENLVVEVKSQASLPGAAEMASLARAVEKMDGWRFELIVTNPRMPREQIPPQRVLTKEEIEARLDEAQRLGHQGSWEAFYLVSWTALEALLRRTLEHVGSPAERDTPTYAIKQLYSLAVLSQADRQILEHGLSVRNRLVHGFQTPARDREPTGDLAAVARRLLSFWSDQQEATEAGA